MATLTDITTGVQAVSAAGAVTGSLDTSGLTGDFTVKLTVLGLSAGKTAVIALEDTANASAFSEAIQVAVAHVVGKVGAAYDITFHWKKYDIPGTRFGATNTKLRFNVLSVTATPGLSIHGWIEQ